MVFISLSEAIYVLEFTDVVVVFVLQALLLLHLDAQLLLLQLVKSLLQSELTASSRPAEKRCAATAVAACAQSVRKRSRLEVEAGAAPRLISLSCLLHVKLIRLAKAALTRTRLLLPPKVAVVL